mmetsp:Transcript_100392/g.313743  ORF Transcript_100392/g.313743 Transcript_100392/m.313743 type:complete len:708 (-) Transcript_100392:87-2210(-)
MPAEQARTIYRTRTGDPALASVEIFDPTELRCEVLRRFAVESSQNAAAERERMNLGGTNWEDQPTWLEERAVQLFDSARQAVLRALDCQRRDRPEVGGAPAAEGAVASPGENAAAVGGGGAAAPPAVAAPTLVDAALAVSPNAEPGAAAAFLAAAAAAGAQIAPRAPAPSAEPAAGSGGYIAAIRVLPVSGGEGPNAASAAPARRSGSAGGAGGGAARVSTHSQRGNVEAISESECEYTSEGSWSEHSHTGSGTDENRSRGSTGRGSSGANAEPREAAATASSSAAGTGAAEQDVHQQRSRQRMSTAVLSESLTPLPDGPRRRPRPLQQRGPPQAACKAASASATGRPAGKPAGRPAGTGQAAHQAPQPPAASKGTRVARSQAREVQREAAAVGPTVVQVTAAPALAPASEPQVGPKPSSGEDKKDKAQTCLGVLLGWFRDRFEGAREYVKMSTFLSFPNDSLFCDPCIEELYQRHRMQQWSPKMDWSLMAFLQMLLWDVAANPSYRLGLVLCFYGAFMTMVLLHKITFVVARERPLPWRKSRGVLLCSFLLGRGVVCHPVITGSLLTEPFTESAREAAVSGVVVIGLGMTNLSAVLALQLHTLDTLILCVTHGLACACWAGLALQITSGDAWHTLVAGHVLVACVCVWQQYEQERFDRFSFEQELLTERGTLLHSADSLVRQGTQADFNFAMQVLYKARAVERLHF